MIRWLWQMYRKTLSMSCRITLWSSLVTSLTAIMQSISGGQKSEVRRSSLTQNYSEGEEKGPKQIQRRFKRFSFTRNKVASGTGLKTKQQCIPFLEIMVSAFFPSVSSMCAYLNGIIYGLRLCLWELPYASMLSSTIWDSISGELPYASTSSCTTQGSILGNFHMSRCRLLQRSSMPLLCAWGPFPFFNYFWGVLRLHLLFPSRILIVAH